MICKRPVSYTHLDVYKRQHIDNSNSAVRLATVYGHYVADFSLVVLECEMSEAAGLMLERITTKLVLLYFSHTLSSLHCAIKSSYIMKFVTHYHS